MESEKSNTKKIRIKIKNRKKMESKTILLKLFKINTKNHLIPFLKIC